MLDPRISSDARVVVLDRTNARYLTRSDFSEPLDDVVSDLSFISLRLVLPAVCEILPEDGRAFLLFKPQFESGGRGLGKSGILPRKYHRALLSEFYDLACSLRLAPQNAVNAPVLPKKNIEYILFLQKGAVPVPKPVFLQRAEFFLN